jgi:SAM-dependent methyltransferase
MVLQPVRAVGAIGLKTGMNVVDIGAGTGLFTFPLADALKGTGKVFATETDPKMIEELTKKASAGEYKNVSPILVQSKGLDPFYTKNIFDVILLADIYTYFWDPESFFKELRPSLTKETGRLYIINPKAVPDFGEYEFQDIARIFQDIRSKGEDFPIFQRLDKASRDFIRRQPDAEVPEGIRAAVISDFNAMLRDRRLLGDLMIFYRTKAASSEQPGGVLEKILTARDFFLGKWLVEELDQAGAFDNDKKDLSTIENEHLRALNRMLLTGACGINKFGVKGPTSIYDGKSTIISTLRKAGFDFVSEFDFLEYRYFLEFKRAN